MSKLPETKIVVIKLSQSCKVPGAHTQTIRFHSAMRNNSEVCHSIQVDTA